jgi:predicted MFS family arabinose efflux permease
VFYLNLPFGLLAAVVLMLAYPRSHRATAVHIDWLGASLLFGGISALLIAIGGDIGWAAWWFATAAVVLLTWFVRLERRAPDPLLPVDLLRTPIVARTLVVVFLVGTALFGAITFIPLFVQGVMGGTATEAGQVLTPLFLGWVAMSIVTARLTVVVGYRPMAISGSVLMMVGFLGLTAVGADSARSTVLAAGSLIGAGMGMSMLSMLLAVQHGVVRAHLGLATSLQQFSRSVGAAVGVAGMGALLTRALANVSIPGGPEALSSAGVILSADVRLQFAAALHQVFLAGAVLAGAALVATFFLPAVELSRSIRAETGEQMLSAEMATLDAERAAAPVSREHAEKPTVN